MKKYIIGIPLGILGVILLFLAGLLIFLTVTEYKPEEVQAADLIEIDHNGSAVGESLTICTWNLGFAGLGKESDFFMDGGKMTSPSRETLEKNIAGIKSYIESNGADVWLFQEIDINSARTKGMDQFELLHDTVGGSSAFAYNYNSPFVPIPLPPLGRVESGVATISRLEMDEGAERVSLPCPFSWPLRTANLKRCLLVTRFAVEGTDKELVVANLHLEAYESGEGRIAQTNLLLELLKKEYEKGNYVIAGGDFNQTFPGMLDIFPIKDEGTWVPNVLSESTLPEGWTLAYDDALATCRLLDKPYSKDSQLFSIDGFILSPNVRLDSVDVDKLGFEYSDHEPVRLKVTLLP